jgi:hypothetical protein
MCTDFTDLNKCCPKDDFPLTRIDQIVDSAASYDIMVLLDYFSRYHQIWLHKEDEKKTSFMTQFGTYCYMRMSEGLCNAGLTFCRMTKAALKDQVGRNVLSYVDDIVVASKKRASYISNLTETFDNIGEAKLKVNPEKCIFEVTQGIEASPNKIKVILQMQPPQTRKEVQKFTCRITALNRFIVKLAQKSLPFFSVLQGSTKVEWRPEQQKTFDDLKQYLQHLPTLTSPEQGQPLILYVSATHTVVSGALVIEKEVAQGAGAAAKHQHLVYFVSKVLAGSKKYYSVIEKICYAVVMCSRKL